MLYFYEKNWKIAAALGAPPPNPRWPPAAGGSTPRPPSDYSHHLSLVVIWSEAFAALTSLVTVKKD